MCTQESALPLASLTTFNLSTALQGSSVNANPRCRHTVCRGCVFNLIDIIPHIHASACRCCAHIRCCRLDVIAVSLSDRCCGSRRLKSFFVHASTCWYSIRSCRSPHPADSDSHSPTSAPPAHHTFSGSRRNPPAFHALSSQGHLTCLSVFMSLGAESCVCCHRVFTCALVLRSSSVRGTLRVYTNTPSSTWSSLR